MLAGSPSITAPIPNDPGFIGYTCQNGNGNIDGLEKHLTNIPTYTCKSFMRAELSFPDCWNGVDLDSTDHKVHMSYRVNGVCPATHPVKVAKITLEMGWRTNQYRPDQLLLSTGDQAGYGKSFLVWLERRPAVMVRLVTRFLINSRILTLFCSL